MWVFPTLRIDISSFIDQKTGGPEKIKPLINAIQDFFEAIRDSENENGAQNRVQVFDSKSIRRELFKIYYLNEEFVLNKTADAAEVLDTILTCIHSWVQISCSPQSQHKSLP